MPLPGDAAEQFRVGITPDFLSQAPGLLEPALEQILRGFEWEFMPDTGPFAQADVIDKYDAIIALGLRFPAQSFSDIRRLAVIARFGVGYDRIDVAACTDAGVILAITPEAVRRPVAEGIFAFIFSLAKSLRKLDAMCRAGQWRGATPHASRSLEGKALGSVGAGNIASEMFRIARGLRFGRLLACDPHIQQAPEGVELASLETVLKESDFVAINCPLTEETRGLIGARELGLMKPAAFLINTARGPIIREEDLIEALRSNQIAGAGLDVFSLEPVSPDNPLLGMDNVIVTPHAVAWTQEFVSDCCLYAGRNVLAVSRGEIPDHVVNRDVLNRAGLLAKLTRFAGSNVREH